MFPIGNTLPKKALKMPSSASTSSEPPFIVFSSAKALGAAILKRRTAAGLSQVAAAKHCRVGRRCFIEVENGKATARLDKVLAVMTGMGLLAIVVPFEVAQAALRPA